MVYNALKGASKCGSGRKIPPRGSGISMAATLATTQARPISVLRGRGSRRNPIPMANANADENTGSARSARTEFADGAKKEKEA